MPEKLSYERAIRKLLLWGWKLKDGGWWPSEGNLDYSNIIENRNIKPGKHTISQAIQEQFGAELEDVGNEPINS